MDVLARREPGTAPRCACRGLLKPDVVLFGEDVPRLPDAAAAVAVSDRLVVVGSSLQVWPVAGLAAQAVRQGAEVHIVCRSPTPYDAQATLHRGPIAPALARILER